MNENVRQAILALGALAEMCGELKRQLIKNGFTRKEANLLVSCYLVATVKPNKHKEDK